MATLERYRTKRSELVARLETLRADPRLATAPHLQAKVAQIEAKIASCDERIAAAAAAAAE